jgi:hypothetical protein
MNKSLSNWLALREAADWAARSERLVRRATEALLSPGTVRGLDLCTGTGSNIRYLIERLPRHQRWLVVDRDAALLDEIPRRLSTWARARGCTVRSERHVSHIRGAELDCDVETREMNLTRLDAELFDGRNLVTASALLDLVSESWLHALADHCRAVGAVALFSITYDGRSGCDPVEPEDDMVRELMNRHQRTDKGLGGPATGPEGSTVAERVFEAAGYQVERAASDWSLGPTEQEFQRQLIEGWAHAASEIAPGQSKTIVDWLKRRLAHVEAGRSRIVVHHVDMVAWLGR